MAQNEAADQSKATAEAVQTKLPESPVKENTPSGATVTPKETESSSTRSVGCKILPRPLPNVRRVGTIEHGLEKPPRSQRLRERA